MKKLLIIFTAALSISSTASASFPSHSTIRLYHTPTHSSLGYLIMRCDGSYFGPGPSGAYDHTHTETLDRCSGGQPLGAIGEIEAECQSAFSKVEQQLACIEVKLEKAVETK